MCHRKKEERSISCFLAKVETHTSSIVHTPTPLLYMILLGFLMNNELPLSLTRLTINCRGRLGPRGSPPSWSIAFQSTGPAVVSPIVVTTTTRLFYTNTPDSKKEEDVWGEKEKKGWMNKQIQQPPGGANQSGEREMRKKKKNQLLLFLFLFIPLLLLLLITIPMGNNHVRI